MALVGKRTRVTEEVGTKAARRAGDLAVSKKGDEAVAEKWKTPRAKTRTLQASAKVEDGFGGSKAKGAGFELTLNTPKLRAELDARTHKLDEDCSAAALEHLRGLLRAGHTGYIYGGGADMNGTLGELKRLAGQVNGSALPADLVDRVNQRGALVDMQAGFSEAAYRKAADGTFMRGGLERAIRGAERLNMGTAELLGYLKAYGLNKQDVEANTDYRFP